MWHMVVFVSCVLAVASPPVPGGGAVVYAMLYAQLGIPAAAVALTLAIDPITDFYNTALEQVNMLLTLANVSDDLGMVDLDVLRAG